LKLEADIYNKYYANPSSLHGAGVLADSIINKSKDTTSHLLKVDPGEIYFTSGGTESNNIAIQGVALRYSSGHIICSTIEHTSVANTVNQLKYRGFKVDLVPVTESGLVKLEILEKLMNDKTVLVSIMHVNNETGVIQDLTKIGAIIKYKNARTLFHSDCVQSYGKIPIGLRESKVDLASFSAHKIHGPRGVGALYIKKNTVIKPFIYGGGQQHGIRPGTENIAGIASFVKASEIAFKDLKINFDKVNQLKEYFVNILTDSIDGIRINSKYSSPYILNISFLGLKSEAIVNALSEYKIYASSGSSCNERQKKTSVIKDFDLDQLFYESAVRFSFSRFNTQDEVLRCIEALKEVVSYLRKFSTIKKGD
jgi:cysteine desulfurase